MLTRINGGEFNADIFKKLHPKIIENYIELATSNVMFQIFKANPNNYDTYCKWYPSCAIVPYIMNLYKADYPTKFNQDTTKGNSIKKIVCTEDYETALFFPSTVTEAIQLMRAGTTGRQNTIPFVTQKDGIVFYGHNKNITSVNIFAFKPLSEYGKDEDLPIPAGSEEIILQFVYKYALGEQPAKMVVDGNPDN